MEPRLDARLTSGLAYLTAMCAMVLSVFWYQPGRPLWISTGAALLLALFAGVYAGRSRFVVVHAAHALIILLIGVPLSVYVWITLDAAFLLLILAFFSMKNALQGYVMNWWLLNLLARWLMPRPIA